MEISSLNIKQIDAVKVASYFAFELIAEDKEGAEWNPVRFCNKQKD